MNENRKARRNEKRFDYKFGDHSGESKTHSLGKQKDIDNKETEERVCGSMEPRE